MASTFPSPKSATTAYLLWFFLGSSGSYRFYLGRPVSGGIQLVLALALVIKKTQLWPLALVLGIWWLVDAFLIPGMVRATEEYEEESLSAEDKVLDALRNEYMDCARRSDMAGAISASSRALAHLEAQGADADDIADLLSDQAGFHVQAGHFTQAAAAAQRAIATLEKGRDKHGLCIALTHLAEAQLGLQRSADAERTFRQVLELQAATPAGKASRDYVQTLNGLARLYTDGNQPERALPLTEEAATLAGRLPAEETLLKLILLAQHADVLVRLKRFEPAESFFQRALMLAKKLPGGATAQVRACRQGLAQVYQALGREEDAARELAAAGGAPAQVNLTKPAPEAEDSIAFPATAPAAPSGPVYSESGAIEFTPRAKAGD